MMRCNFSLLFLLLLSTLGLANEYQVSHYTRHQGLPQDYIYSLMQDNKNYLWVGTGSGLAKFDGKQFVHFDTKDGLKQDFVTSSKILGSGERLFAHFNGEISSYFNGKFSAFSSKKISNASINTMFYDKRARLWAGTKEGELILIENGRRKLKKWIVGEYESVTFIDSVSVSNHLFLSTESHLLLFNIDEVSQKSIVYKSNLPDSSGIKNISRLNKNTWIVSSLDNHLFNVKVVNSKLVFIPIALPGEVESNVLFMQSFGLDKFWVFTQPGVWNEYRILGGKPSLISTVSDPIFSSKIVPNVLFEDNEGNIWIGTFGSGLYKFALKRSAFLEIGQQVDAKVNSLVFEAGHGILLGTSKGLFESKEGKKPFKKINNKLGETGIVSVCFFEKDVFLVATENSKVYFWNRANDTWLEWELPVTEQDKIKQIIKDKKENVWIATTTGAILYEIEKKQFKILTMGDGLAHNYVYSVFADSRGKVWFGTHKSGLSYFEDKKVVTIKSPLENSGLDINCFVEDNEGRIWVGTSGQGIFVIDENDNFVNYLSTKEGLVSDYVYFFQKDQQGAIWVGHKNGLSRVLSSVKNGAFISDYSQYLAGNELSPAFYSKINGNDIWLGGIGKCIKLNIDSENKAPEGSYVDISDLKLNYEPIDWQKYGEVNYTNEIPDYLKFGYNDNLLTFSFNGISFSFNDKLRYQYKLEGFDDNWSLLTEQNFVSYNKLPPGKYTFLVKSRNYAGIWSANTALHFEIKPPYWETWWFRLIVVVIVIAVFYAIIKIRTSTLKNRNKALEIEKVKLEKEIQERKRIENKLLRSELSLKNTNQELSTLIYRASHDLRGPVSTISGLVNVAKLRIAEQESLSFFGMINTSVEKLDMILKKLFLVSEIKQNEIQPEVFNLKISILDVLNTFADAIKERDFQVEVDDLLMRDFCTDRKLFETVIKNIVDNSLMYGRKSGGQIVITLDENGHELVVKIWDNGKGIKSELIEKVFDMFYKASDISKGNGLGLYIAKNSVQMLNGEIFISSKEHEYTLVEVHIPEIKKT
jgi:signal transduction histidine kinase/ligand-binding sensor domain-containing protein